MNRLSVLLLFLYFLSGNSCDLSAQKVGLVLSGGGASGMAHIGVIKALEEQEIPIDFITGTSMGALIGGLYAAGFSVEELERFVNDPSFILAVNGSLQDSDVYYFSKSIEDASLIRIKLSTENLVQKSIPTNLVTPDLMEFQIMNLTAQASQAANYDFDQLFVPFRCVAADIQNKKQIIFSNGNLSLAMRASSTYPFYFKPIKVDDKLLFDGGLYNNFPADVMYNEFLPDVIIGSNVASGYLPPEEDDLLSQIRSMISSQSNFTLQCDYGLIIEPPSTIGIFDFSNPNAEIEKGYLATLEKIEMIKVFVEERRSEDDLANKRAEFRQKFKPNSIGKVDATGDLSKKQKDYILSMFGPVGKSETYTFNEFKGHFLRVTQDEKFRHIYPISHYNDSAKHFDIGMVVQRERDLTAYFGGNFSSRPINMGYIGLKYNVFGRTSASIMANSYFGKFYGSALLSAKIDFGGKKRYYIAPHIILNRWDFFRNRATFFELSRPSYIVKNEVFGGVEAVTSWGNNTVLKFDLRYGETLDNYYQTENFTPEDTADATRFKLNTIALGIDRNTLNRKQFASKGTRLELSARGVAGKESTEYGTTIPDIDSVRVAYRQWAELRLRYENYFYRKGPFILGAELEGVYSIKPNFDNYTATVISAPSWNPIPESKTIFIDSHRSRKYIAGGIKLVVEVRRNLEIRAEGYAMEPLEVFVRTGENQTSNERLNGQTQYIGAGALVFHSPLGPVSLNLNYYDKREDSPWSFLFNFGYTIFNKSVYQK